MKKMLFVLFSIKVIMMDNATSLVNHSLVFLAPILKKYGYKVEIINLTREFDEIKFRNLVKKVNPSIIGFSFSSHQFKYAIKYSNALKDLNTIQIAGGKHVTLSPEDSLLRTSFDGVCIGEGELPLEKLLINIDKKNDICSTKGFYWNKDGKIIKNELLAPLKNIDLPVDYSIYEKVIILSTKVERKNVLTSDDYHLRFIFGRGCPFNCTFCFNKALRELYPKNVLYIRVPSVEYCISSIKSVLSKYPNTKLIEIEDDNFVSNKKWFLDFAKKYGKEINIPYQIFGRIECIDPDIVSAFKASNCFAFWGGIESGDEEYRRKYLNRHYTDGEVLQKTSLLRKAGIKVLVNVILGLPFEKIGMMNQTFRLIKKIRPYYGNCSFFYPYEKTELYHIAKENNLIKDNIDDLVSLGTNVAIKMPKFRELYCRFMYHKIFLYFQKQREGWKGVYLRPFFKASKYLKTKSELYSKLVKKLSEI